MPRYQISSVEHGVILEGEAVELPDKDAARDLIVQLASETLSATGGDVFEHHLEVRVSDGNGLMLYVISIAGVEAPAVRTR